MILKRALTLLVLIFILFSCKQEKSSVKNLKLNSSPYDKYVKSLKTSEFDQTVLGQRWLTAGEKVFKDDAMVGLPYQEAGRFSPEKPSASGVKFKAVKGEVIKIKVELIDSDDFLLFTDLFYLNKESVAKNIYSSDIDKETFFEIKESGTYLLRLQPELMKGARYTLSIDRSDKQIAHANPLNFLWHSKKVSVTKIKANGMLYGDLYRAKKNFVEVFCGPDERSKLVGRLGQNNPFQVTGRSGNWFKIELFSGADGFVHEKYVEPTSRSYSTINLKNEMPVYAEIYNIATPVDTLKKKDKIAVFAEIGPYLLIKRKGMEQAWIKYESFKNN